MKNSFNALVVCIGLATSLGAMEKQSTKYCLRTRYAEVFVSEKLIQSSPYLRELRSKRPVGATDLMIDMWKELFPSIRLIDRLLHVSYDQQIAIIKELSWGAVGNLRTVLFKFKMQQFYFVVDKAQSYNFQMNPVDRGSNSLSVQPALMEKYHLNSEDAEIVVSGKLIEASLPLRELWLACQPRSKYLAIDLAKELFPQILLADALICLSCEELQIAEIKKLSDEKYEDFMTVIIELDLRLLFEVALQAYKEKLLQLQDYPEQLAYTKGVSSLKNLALSCFGKNFDDYDQDSFLASARVLPISLWHALLCSIQLSDKNFKTVLASLQELNKTHQEENTKKYQTLSKILKPLWLTDQQYHSLSLKIAERIQELASAKKILTWLQDHTNTVSTDHKMKFRIVQHILRSKNSPLTNESRFKIGWRMALTDGFLRDALIDELADFMTNNDLKNEGIPDFLLNNVPINGHDFFLNRALLASIAQELILFSKHKTAEALPSMHAAHFVGPAISNSYICSFIEQIQHQLKDPSSWDHEHVLVKSLSDRLKMFPRHPLGVKGKHFQAILRYNLSVPFCLDAFTIKRDLEMKLLLNQDVRGLGARQTDKLFNYKLGCARLARFSKIPFRVQNKDDLIQIVLNKEFLSAIQEMCKETDLLRRLLDLVFEGADCNVQDAEGNTVAHLAFSLNDSILFDFLYLVCSLRLDSIRMDLANKQGETPLILLQAFLAKNSDDLHKLCVIAQATNTKLSDTQIAQVHCALEVPAYGELMIENEKEIHDSLTFYEKTFWRLNESDASACEKIRVLWQSVLKEKDEKLRNKLFDAIIRMLGKMEDQPEVPELFFTCIGLPSLYSFVKDLQEGRKTIQESITALQSDLIKEQASLLQPIDLIKLLVFSECLWQCLYQQEQKIENDERALNKKLVKCTNSEDVCECITQGAQIQYRDEYGNSIVHYAVMQGNEQLVSDLFTLFARKIKADAKNNEGNTPFLLAAQHPKKALELCSLLVKKAIIKNLAFLAADSLGLTALEHLNKQGHQNSQVFKKLLRIKDKLVIGSGEELLHQIAESDDSDSTNG